MLNSKGSDSPRAWMYISDAPKVNPTIESSWRVLKHNDVGITFWELFAHTMETTIDHQMLVYKTNEVSNL